MRQLSWLLTIVFTLSSLALGADRRLAGADVLAPGLAALAVLACPFLWAPQNGLLAGILDIPGKRRFLLALALMLATPLLLPWPSWL